MIRIRNPLDSSSDPSPEITPLIDIMFLLLIFFMLTTTFEKERSRDAIIAELPSAQQSRALDTKDVILVSVDENGSYGVNGNPCAGQSLGDVLSLLRKETADSVVLIAGHRGAPYQSIVYILDVLQSIGINSFSHEVTSP